MAITVQSSSTPPPKKTTTPPPKKPVVDPNKAEKLQKEREEGLNGIFQVISAVSIMTGQWADAGAFSMHGPNVSRETAILGTRYDSVGNALDTLSQVGPFTAILGAAMPLVLQILANHKKLPSEKLSSLGIVNPELLEGQMRMEAQKQALEMEQQQRREKETLDAVEREWNEMRKEKVPA
jgi:hypothetical protein